MQVKVRFTAEVNPTEDRGKLQKAVVNLTGFDASVEERVEAGRLMLVCEREGAGSLGRLKSMLESQRIREAARVVLARGMRANRIMIAFNRQAAFAGKVSFSDSPDDSPLGPIRVEIEADDPYGVIDWVAPPPRVRRIGA